MRGRGERGEGRVMVKKVNRPGREVRGKRVRVYCWEVWQGRGGDNFGMGDILVMGEV